MKAQSSLEAMSEVAASGANPGALRMMVCAPLDIGPGAIIADLPYGEATSPLQAMRVMASRSRLPDAALGDLVRAASAHSGPWRRIAIWHGDDAVTVLPGSPVDLARQWADVHGAVTRAADDLTGAVRRANYWRAPCGGVAVERHRIVHTAHGTVLKTGAADGCGAAGPHLIDIGVSSSGEIAHGCGLSRHRPSRPLARRGDVGLARIAS